MSEVVGLVEERYVYPVKGMAGTLLPDEVPMGIDRYGAEGSRRWAIVDQHGQLVTARMRGMEGLLGIKPEPVYNTDGSISDDFILGEEVKVHADDTRNLELVEVFKDTMFGRKSEIASRWVNMRLDKNNLNVVYFAREYPRLIHPEKAWKGDAPRAFVDNAPLHIINRDTLNAAQSRWPDFDADPRRFRPDIVVSLPLESEYDLIARQVHLGSVMLRAVRPLDRCPVPGINPDTLERSKVVAKMLSTDYRRETPQGIGELPCMGIGLNVIQPGQISALATIEAG